MFILLCELTYFSEVRLLNYILLACACLHGLLVAGSSSRVESTGRFAPAIGRPIPFCHGCVASSPNMHMAGWLGQKFDQTMKHAFGCRCGKVLSTAPPCAHGLQWAVMHCVGWDRRTSVFGPANHESLPAETSKQTPCLCTHCYEACWTKMKRLLCIFM